MSHTGVRSFMGRASIERSAECACYQCLQRYPASEVHSYVDGDMTALCPRCRIDSVLASDDYDGSLPSPTELKKLRDVWFAGSELLVMIDGDEPEGGGGSAWLFDPLPSADD